MITRRAALYGLAGIGVSVLIYMMFGRGFETPPRQVKTEVIASNLRVPWSIIFLNPSEALFTERGGIVKLLDLDSGRVDVWGRVDVAAVGEGGLLGIAKRCSKIYLYYTYRSGSNLFNKVSAYSDEGGLTDEVTIIDRIPGGRIHNGGRIRFGPDGKLYITTGEAGSPWISQDIQSLGGKILRLEHDGRIPADNPFRDSPVYSLGHRNPQGLDWQRETGLLYSTEHGPSGEGGRFAHDEVNLITAGGNYGWPDAIGDEKREQYIPPILHSGLETWAPSGCSFYYGKELGDWSGSLFFAALRGAHLHRVELDNSRVIFHEKILQSQYGRLRDVVQGPDGCLYILTSNWDGRGQPAPDDDKIVKIVSRV